jgi:hypothetical protein
MTSLVPRRALLAVVLAIVALGLTAVAWRLARTADASLKAEGEMGAARAKGIEGAVESSNAPLTDSGTRSPEGIRERRLRLERIQREPAPNPP